MVVVVMVAVVIPPTGKWLFHPFIGFCFCACWISFGLPMNGTGVSEHVCSRHGLKMTFKKFRQGVLTSLLESDATGVLLFLL